MAGKNLKILILGGHGFVGHNLAAALEGNGHQVTAKSRRDGWDLLDHDAIEQNLAHLKPDIIFNCAAHTGSVHYVSANAAKVAHDNMTMALNLYRGIQKACPSAITVNPLSNCSYPGNSATQVEKEWWNGPVHESVFAYGNAKRFLYVVAKSYYMQYGIKSINFLIPNTFGPGDSADPNKTHALNGMIIRMIKSKKNGDGKFEIWGSGNPIREWAYIKDVISILIKSLNLKVDLLEPVNLAQNKGYSIKQSAEFIAQALNFEGKLEFNTKYPDGDPVKIMDDQKFRQIFSNFKFYDHQQGIRETVEYYKSIL